MSAKSLHLNLLSAQERQSSSPVRMKFLLPVLSGIGLAAVIVWGAFIGVQYAYVNIAIENARAKIREHQAQNNEVETLKARSRNLQAEVDQYLYYINGRRTYGDLLRKLALVIPETITLEAMTIPPQPRQELRPPIGSNLPMLQGPTSSVEVVTLRLTGLATEELDVFELMANLKEPAFTNSLIIAENNVHPELSSPQVLAFRQESPREVNGKRGVFFDIVYQLKPREFVK